MARPADCLRVMLDMTLLENNLGGSGVYARALLAALKKRDDLKVTVMSAPRHRRGIGTLEWVLRGARSELIKDRPDVVHYPGFLAPMDSMVPSVITIHDLALGRMPEGHPLEWRLYYHHVLPRVARKATAVVTATETTKRDIISLFGVAPERIAVTPYGIDQNFYTQSVRKRPDDSRPIVVFAGPPIRRKNLDIVLRALAFAPAGSALNRAQLMITGSSRGDYPAYDRWIDSNGISERVSWLGSLPYAKLPALYAGADVLAYPSFLEGFGFPPLEAMAAGTPVVASNASCLPEVLGDAAVLVDPNDDAAFLAATESVLSDQRLRQRLSMAGASHARRFTWERCAEMTAAVYWRIARNIAVG